MVAGDLPVVISCASLALADAGIMMYDLVASVSVVCVLDRKITVSSLHFQLVSNHKECSMHMYHPYLQLGGF